MLPRREEFFEDVRRAVRLEQKPKVVADSDLLSPDRMARALRGAALWLTPKVVARYAPDDFVTWPDLLQARLSASVESFRAAAAAVPPDGLPGPDQFASGLAAFRELTAAVREVLLFEWRDAAGRFLAEAEGWAGESGWRSRRVERTVRETLLGEYTLPQLQFFADADLYVFNPVARFVPRAMGSYDLAIQPSHELTTVYRDYDGRWYADLDAGRGADGRTAAWGRETFRAILDELRSLV